MFFFALGHVFILFFGPRIRGMFFFALGYVFILFFGPVPQIRGTFFWNGLGFLSFFGPRLRGRSVLCFYFISRTAVCFFVHFSDAVTVFLNRIMNGFLDKTKLPQIYKI
jgi:hypothetical protein